MKKELFNLRKNYSKGSLNITDCSDNPFKQFDIWLKEATDGLPKNEVNCTTLSTVDKNGYPQSRIVLLKEYSENGFVFFTNYNSEKGKNISLNPKVSLLFFWEGLERQIRIIGDIERTSESYSDDYFYSRPINSQIGAIVSPQSEIINTELEIKVNEFKNSNTPIIRPNHWGGYIVKPHQFEFWQGRPSRLHDRVQYNKSEKIWLINKIAP